MPEYKNQHYVPRAYFKPFSLNGAGRAINLYLLNHDRRILSAPITGQCAKPYFYGEDGQLEKLLGQMEGAYGSLVSRLAESGVKPNQQDRWLLLYFVLLQSMRTSEQVSRALSRMTQMADFFRSFEEAHGKKWDASQDPTPKKALQELMFAFNDQLQAGTIDDLKIAIIRNRSSRDFVTSDDPAVMTNRWLIQRRGIRSFGFNAAGLTLFLPLGPRKLVLAYDPAVYSLPSACRDEVHLNRESDVLAFNEHQYMRAADAIYFAKPSEAADIAAEYKATVPFRPERWDRFTTAKYDSETETHSKFVVDEPAEIAKSDHMLFHLTSEWPVPPRWPSILRYRSNAHGYSRGRLIVRRAHMKDPFDDLGELPAYVRV
ncbi:DUF4238 domain-containing protein [Aurantiacibacter xanthus]|uniref:DUF4238 domain-containing protein n=1 Tax=Aurantiacibacter xanthus TaxID=1784712 RepID=A0A3A1P541_9SPHN|nr:DUF4238 domain-containing protein [Aurantiacibacter xanthus]RIV84384.1 DUF4238 domain-containing protein [Aurantiacibacter xanthus]